MSDQPAPAAVMPRSFAELTEAQQPAPGGRRLAVRFLRRWTVYFEGDVAVFGARLARRLVATDRAEPVNIGYPENGVPANAVLATRYPIPAEARQRQHADDDDDGL